MNNPHFRHAFASLQEQRAVVRRLLPHRNAERFEGLTRAVNRACIRTALRKAREWEAFLDRLCPAKRAC